MKILIIGNSNHQYVINFSKHFKAQYHGNVKVYAPHYNVLDRIPKLKHPYRKYVLKKLAKKNFGNYDICHIQSFEKNTEIFEQIIKAHCKNLIITYWGGDLNFATQRLLNKQKSLNQFASCITFTNTILLQTHDRLFPELVYKPKKIVEVGSEPFNELVNIKNNISTKESKNYFLLPQNKLIIQIGYSGASFHQHIKILDELEKLSNEKKANFFLIVPLTYGLTPKYRKEIINKLRGINIEYKIFLDFLPDKDLALLRKATDLFVIMTINDQLCSTLLEHLYMGNKIIAGDWLPYHIVNEEWGGKITWVKNFTDFADKINSYLENQESIPNTGNLERHVKPLLYWPDNIKKWINLFDTLISNKTN